MASAWLFDRRVSLGIGPALEAACSPPLTLPVVRTATLSLEEQSDDGRQAPSGAASRPEGPLELPAGLPPPLFVTCGTSLDPAPGAVVFSAGRLFFLASTPPFAAVCSFRTLGTEVLSLRYHPLLRCVVALEAGGAVVLYSLAKRLGNGTLEACDPPTAAPGLDQSSGGILVRALELSVEPARVACAVDVCPRTGRLAVAGGSVISLWDLQRSEGRPALVLEIETPVDVSLVCLRGLLLAYASQAELRLVGLRLQRTRKHPPAGPRVEPEPQVRQQMVAYAVPSDGLCSEFCLGDDGNPLTSDFSSLVVTVAGLTQRLEQAASGDGDGADEAQRRTALNAARLLKKRTYPFGREGSWRDTSHQVRVNRARGYRHDGISSFLHRRFLSSDRLCSVSLVLPGGDGDDAGIDTLLVVSTSQDVFVYSVKVPPEPPEPLGATLPGTRAAAAPGGACEGAGGSGGGGDSDTDNDSDEDWERSSSGLREAQAGAPLAARAAGTDSWSRTVSETSVGSGSGSGSAAGSAGAPPARQPAGRTRAARASQPELAGDPAGSAALLSTVAVGAHVRSVLVRGPVLWVVTRAGVETYTLWRDTASPLLPLVHQPLLLWREALCEVDAGEVLAVRGGSSDAADPRWLLVLPQLPGSEEPHATDLPPSCQGMPQLPKAVDFELGGVRQRAQLHMVRRRQCAHFLALRERSRWAVVDVLCRAAALAREHVSGRPGDAATTAAADTGLPERRVRLLVEANLALSHVSRSATGLAAETGRLMRGRLAGLLGDALVECGSALAASSREPELRARRSSRTQSAAQPMLLRREGRRTAAHANLVRAAAIYARSSRSPWRVLRDLEGAAAALAVGEDTVSEYVRLALADPVPTFVSALAASDGGRLADELLRRVASASPEALSSVLVQTRLFWSPYDPAAALAVLESLGPSPSGDERLDSLARAVLLVQLGRRREAADAFSALGPDSLEGFLCANPRLLNEWPHAATLCRTLAEFLPGSLVSILAALAGDGQLDLDAALGLAGEALRVPVLQQVVAASLRFPQPRSGGERGPRGDDELCAVAARASSMLAAALLAELELCGQGAPPGRLPSSASSDGAWWRRPFLPPLGPGCRWLASLEEEEPVVWPDVESEELVQRLLTLVLHWTAGPRRRGFDFGAVLGAVLRCRALVTLAWQPDEAAGESWTRMATRAARWSAGSASSAPDGGWGAEGPPPPEPRASRRATAAVLLALLPRCGLLAEAARLVGTRFPRTAHEYCSAHAGSDEAAWAAVVGALSLGADAADQHGTDRRAALHLVLERATSVLGAAALVRVVPEHGSVEFFLPYLLRAFHSLRSVGARRQMVRLWDATLGQT